MPENPPSGEGGAGGRPAEPAGAAPKTSGAPGRPVEPTRTIPLPAGPPDPPPPADLVAPAFITSLQAAVPGAVQQVSHWVGDWTLIVEPRDLLRVATWLRDAPEAAFDFCSDVTATDWPPRPRRFDVIYCLYSVPRKQRVRVKVRVGEEETVPTVTAIWPAANWLEREVFDMFGIRFEGHPDLRRILMPDDWQGHPERKDYPLEGPGELLMEKPGDWLQVRQQGEIE